MANEDIWINQFCCKFFTLHSSDITDFFTQLQAKETEPNQYFPEIQKIIVRWLRGAVELYGNADFSLKDYYLDCINIQIMSQVEFLKRYAMDKVQKDQDFGFFQILVNSFEKFLGTDTLYSFCEGIQVCLFYIKDITFEDLKPIFEVTEAEFSSKIYFVIHRTNYSCFWKLNKRDFSYEPKPDPSAFYETKLC